MRRKTGSLKNVIVKCFSLLTSLMMGIVYLGNHAYALGTEEEALRACLMASKENPCKVEGYAGSFPNLNDPALGTNLNGCYDFNFTRRADALSLNAPAQCPDDRWPIYVDVRKTTHCPNDKELKCETGSYIRAQVVYSMQGAGHAEGKSSSKFGYIKLPQSIPWILSATTVLDRMEEVCKGLKSQRYEWSDTTRACTKKPEYICDDLGLTWDNTKKTCTPPSLNCANCPDKGNYCSGYLYRPQNEWCFCSGTKTDGRCAIPIPPAAPAAREVPVQCEFCSHPRMRGYQDPDGTGPFGPKKKCNCRCKEELIQAPYNYFVWDSGDCKLNCTINEQYCHDRSQNFNSGSCSCEGFYCNQGIEAAKCNSNQTFNAGSCSCVDNSTISTTSTIDNGSTSSTIDTGSTGTTSTQSTIPGCDQGAKQAECIGMGMSFDLGSCSCVAISTTTSTETTTTTSSTVLPGDTSIPTTTTSSTSSTSSSISTVTTTSTSTSTSTSTTSTTTSSSTIGSSISTTSTSTIPCSYQCFPVSTTGSSSALGLNGYGKVKIATCAKGKTISVRLDPYEVPNQVRISGALSASSPWMGYSYYGNSTAGGYCQHPGEWGSYLNNSNTFWTSSAITGDGDVFIEVMTLNGDAPECPGSPDLNDGWSLNAYCN